ncbi:hypothetical protein GMB51_11255 [Turicibacter sanguinis]|nr:hypothetical protein [Turicibacter sanguinis]MTN51525.1 hypothetical protein [Turicibacter sanguinis]MTN54723.1 hypothetical protein [Turicibacter sanguinis]MTN57806.1 hypothetical protein [Turicibacter sanguinis]MTN60921.1 hypothetical protein [Turicibacter sanguinis]
MIYIGVVTASTMDKGNAYETFSFISSTIIDKTLSIIFVIAMIYLYILLVKALKTYINKNSLIKK